MLWCNLLPKYNLYIGHLFPKTPPVQDKVYLGSSIPRLIGDQVFWFLLKPCIENFLLVYKFENLGILPRTRRDSLVGSMSASQAAIPQFILASRTFFHGKNNIALPLTQEDLVVSYW